MNDAYVEKIRPSKAHPHMVDSSNAQNIAQDSSGGSYSTSRNTITNESNPYTCHFIYGLSISEEDDTNETHKNSKMNA